jgi:RNA polymerase sigma-70 factor (ECF subfamily)
MTDREFLAERFEADRNHLRTVAYRMLGSRAEAEDAVQATFLRLMRAGTDDVANFRGWLTTIVARVCLDMLRKRESRREMPLDAEAEALPAPDDLERDQIMADAVGAAMLIVLEMLTPAERVAFVLHDMFDIAFDDIASVVGRSPAAARQLASRGRRRVQGAPTDLPGDPTRRREVVRAFLEASQSGDLSALLALLDPDIVLSADKTAVAISGLGKIPQLAPKIHGHDGIVAIFKGRARAAQLALVEGESALVFAPGGRPGMVVEFAVDEGRIVEISMVADPAHVASLAIEF